MKVNLLVHLNRESRVVMPDKEFLFNSRLLGYQIFIVSGAFMEQEEQLLAQKPSNTVMRCVGEMTPESIIKYTANYTKAGVAWVVGGSDTITRFAPYIDGEVRLCYTDTAKRGRDHFDYAALGIGTLPQGHGKTVVQLEHVPLLDMETTLHSITASADPDAMADFVDALTGFQILR